MLNAVHHLDKIFVIFVYSLLVAIGIEAFNRLSQLKNEERDKDINQKKTSVDKQPLVENKQEDEYSTASEILSSYNVCIHLYPVIYYFIS